jgi:hypothetical protein
MVGHVDDLLFGLNACGDTVVCGASVSIGALFETLVGF